MAWFGAVLAYVAIIFAKNYGELNIPNVYPILLLLIYALLIPLSILSLSSGILQAYFTPWGLTKHYWIVVKLALTILATLVLIGHSKEVSSATESSSQFIDYQSVIVESPFIVHSTAGLVVLIFISYISIYKPWGKTNFSPTKKNTMTYNKQKPAKPWAKYALIAFTLLLVIIIVKHLSDGGLSHH